MARSSSPNDQDARRGQWLKGVLDLCVLALIGDGSSYGYDLATRLEEAGLGTVKGGTLYPRLTAMEKAGLLASEWKAGDGGPGRKYYRVTAEGTAVLNFAGPQWHGFADVVGSLMPSTAQMPPPPTPRTPATNPKSNRKTRQKTQ